MITHSRALHQKMAGIRWNSGRLFRGPGKSSNLLDSGNFHGCSTSPFMPQPVAGCAEGHKVVRVIAPAPVARHDVMDFQEPGSSAAWCPATMLVPCEHLPAHAWRDGGRVSASLFADCGIAAHSFGLSFTQLPVTRIRLDGHPARGCIFMDVDLDRRAAWEVPPGALFGL